MTPTDVWEWDAETGEVVGLDVDGSQRGIALSVDFSDEPPGRLAAAAPDMARALMATGVEKAGQWHTRGCWSAGRGCIVACQQASRALRKAGVLP